MRIGGGDEGVVWRHREDAPAKELYPGVQKQVLWEGEAGRKALLIHIASGRRFLELDVHEPGPEAVFVLSGTFEDGVRAYPAGTFIHNPRGSSHVPQSTTGCTLLVYFPEG
ncbi:MAG TPA: cupin domain-containing protein [Holophagaceae bacterium]|nr:cupin domain-containing protein [Holophagaceae bacterium]